MKKTLNYVCIVLVLGFSSHAYSDTIYFKGAMKVKDSLIPAKATYEEVVYFSYPIIKITYKISGEEYLTRYMSDFGDEVIYKPGSIIVHNESDDKKQNYYFQGKEVSLLKFLLPSN